MFSNYGTKTTGGFVMLPVGMVIAAEMFFCATTKAQAVEDMLEDRR